MATVNELIQTNLIWQVLTCVSALTTFILGLIISHLIAKHNNLGIGAQIMTGKLFGIHLIMLFFYNYYQEIKALNKVLWFFRLSLVTTLLFVFIWSL